MTSLVLFYLLGALCLGGALGVVVTRNVVYAALALLVALMAIAGLFLLVFAQFLALVQVLIYGGAITIVILFAIMLTRLEEFQTMSDNPQRPLAALAALALLGILLAAFLQKAPSSGEARSIDFEVLGDALFTKWAVPFELVSLVLLVALIGAIVLARGEEEGGE